MYKLTDLVSACKNHSRAIAIYLTDPYFRSSSKGRHFEDMLGVLGRDLRAEGGVILSYEGHENSVMTQILEKPWSDNDRAALAKTPGLLIIDKDFRDFNPREHSYFHIDLRPLFQGVKSDVSAPDFMMALHKVFLGDNDLFHELESIRIGMRRSAAADAVSIGARLCGVSIDVKALVKALR